MSETIEKITSKTKINEAPASSSGEHSYTEKSLFYAYIGECKKYKLLTKEEELEAFKNYRQDGDQESKKLLIVSNLRLVVKMALWMAKMAPKFNGDFHRVPLLDLIQEGNEGLIKAIEKYDPQKNVKFSYYATLWIRAYILEYLVDTWSLSKTITTARQKKLFRKLNKEKRSFNKEDVDPNAKNIAEKLNVKEEEVRYMEKIMAGIDISLYAPLSKGNDTCWLDVKPSDTDTENLVIEKDKSEKVRNLIARFRETLSEKELYIFNNRTCCENPLSVRELASKIGISKSRVSQLDQKIIDQLKEFVGVEEKHVT